MRSGRRQCRGGNKRDIVPVTLYTILTVILSPYLLGNWVCKKVAKSEMVKEHELKKSRTPPKAEKRGRRLSISNNNRECEKEKGNVKEKSPTLKTKGSMKRLGKKQTVNSQHESLFFKLPGELRNMIYDLVVTDAAIHIFYKKETEKLCAYRCMRPPTWQVYRGHDGCLLSRHFFEGDSSFYRNYDPRVGVLPLLRTCRMIYTELIPIVYSKPTFMFSSFNHFLLFTSSILPSRFSSLQSIHFERHGRNAQPKARPFENAFYEPLLYRPRPEPIPMRNPILPSLSQANGPMTAHLGVSVWWATCKVLQRLPGLKRLRVDIEWPMCLSQPQSQRHGLTSVAERIYRDIVDGFVMLAEGREREEAREIIEVYWDSFPTPADGEEWARLGFMKVC